MNALYEFYAYQFAQAGSPNKVQETVGSGLLPTHIEHTLPDVASLFKKILIALPGGLLGSLELFEALRNVFFKFDPDPPLPDVDVNAIRAKLVALAVSSVTSTKRVSLIQAVIGLVAYFGHEAEEARKNTANATDGAEAQVPSSELMGYQSLGVVLGPLLLGDLTDSIDPSPPTPEDAPRKSSESTRKATKKQKRASIPNKLDRDATLSAHVDRANLTANIMELLLIIWKDVIEQLRQIHRTESTISLPSASKELRKITKGTGSRNTFGNSEEEVLFLDMLGGRPLPDGFKGAVKMKKKIRVSSRSPVARGVLEASDEDAPDAPATIASSGELPARPGKEPAAAEAAKDDGANAVNDIGSSGSSTVGSQHTETLVRPGLEEDQRSRSFLEMDRMSMGIILPRLQDDPITPLHKDLLRPASRPRTPPTAKRDRSSSETPETALRDVSKPHTIWKVSNSSESSVEKPLPPIGEAQLAELSPPQSNDEDCDPSKRSRDFPARKSSLPQHNYKPLLSKPLEPALEPFRTPAEYNASAEQQSCSATTPNSRNVSQVVYEAADGDGKLFERSKRGSVRLIAQKFDQAPKTSSGIGSLDSNAPKVYAQIYALPPSDTKSHDDPFLSSAETSPERSPGRESRIPKPVQDVSSVCKPLIRSPSPPKSPPRPTPKRPTPKNYLKKRSSVYNIVPNDHVVPIKTDPVKSSDSTPTIETTMHTSPISQPLNITSAPPLIWPTTPPPWIPLDPVPPPQKFIPPPPSTPTWRPTPPTQPFSPPPPPPRTFSHADYRRTNSGNFLEVAPTRSLAAYSSESLRRIHLLEEPAVAQHIPNRVVSIDIKANEPTRISDSASPEGCEGIKRTGSINATLLAEINRLKHQLEQKAKEVNATRRSLDAVRDAREVAISSSGGELSGSVSKGTLSEEVRQARKELAQWKRRAEWAESRLAAAERKIDSGRGTPRRGSEMEKGSSVRGTPRSGSEMEKGKKGKGMPRKGSEIEKPREWFHE